MLQPGCPYRYRDIVKNKENSAEVCGEEGLREGPSARKRLYLSTVNTDTPTETHLAVDQFRYVQRM